MAVHFVQPLILCIILLYKNDNTYSYKLGLCKHKKCLYKKEVTIYNLT